MDERFIINQVIHAEENLYCEFKEVKGFNPLKSIVNTADESQNPTGRIPE